MKTLWLLTCLHIGGSVIFPNEAECRRALAYAERAVPGATCACEVKA